MSEADLTISQLAARTGVKPGTLRVWERRHGFPRPARTSGGERRYAEGDVERVDGIVRDREAGMSLALAVDRALARSVVVDDMSLFGSLRARRPDVDVHVLSKRALVALSWAIEDECCARAQRPLIYGFFQRQRFYRAAQRRWRDLDATAELAVVFADFPAFAEPPASPVEVPIAASSPRRREWAVVCDAPGYAVCLVGWERSGRRPVADLERSFEVAWSVEPDVVRHAAQLCHACLEAAAPASARRVGRRLSEPPSAIGAQQMRVAAALTSRMAAYLDA